MSTYLRPKKVIGECRLYEDYVGENIKQIVEKYSLFCRGKTVRNIKYLSRGSYGIISSLEINGISYVIKMLISDGDPDVNEMELEVSIPSILEDVRRKDNQRICVPIYDCFFICQPGKNYCEGKMFYIMEKGNESCNEILINNNGILGDVKNKTFLVRDLICKMIENIDLLVYRKNIIWWDLKPLNTVYNFKINPDTGNTIINPIIIDLDEQYITDSFQNLVDIRKLNYFLGNIKYKGEPVYKFKIDENHLKKLYSFSMSFSYILIFLSYLVEYKSRIGNKVYKFILGYSFFSKTRLLDEEQTIPFDILRIMFNPKREDLWLNVALQVILKTNYVDSTTRDSKSSDFRTQFFHYNSHRIAGSYDRKFANVQNQLKKYYYQMVEFFSLENKYKNTNIEMGEIEEVFTKMETGDNLTNYMDSLEEEPEIESNNNFVELNNEYLPSHQNASGIESRSRNMSRKLFSRIFKRD